MIAVMQSSQTILAIETSCDETAAAVVRGGREIIANVVASQIDEHRRYGGVVPEVASRQHILAIDAVVRAALAALPGGLAAVDAVAATHGPGLAGALLTGLNTAKAIAWRRELPFIPVNHLDAHIYANWLDTGDNRSLPTFPLVALLVSGGHTLLALITDHGAYQLLGQTRDDAAGEAFDKVARMLGLGFPGGPAIQRVAADIAKSAPLPRAWLRDSYDFSFSGLKTAVLHKVRAHTATGGQLAVDPEPWVVQLAHAFQESVVDVLVSKTVDAARTHGATEILLAGGVAANAHLRAEMQRRAHVPVRVPPSALCTDNAAMIAAAAFYRGAATAAAWEIDVRPALRLGAL